MSFTEAGEQMWAAAKVGLYEAALDIMAKSDYLVPKDTLTLLNSHKVFPPEEAGDRASVTLGYGFGTAINPKTGHIAAQYAVPVHERLDQQHAPPTQAKFLETAVLGSLSSFPETVAAYISRWSKGERGLSMTMEALTPTVSDFIP